MNIKIYSGVYDQMYLPVLRRYGSFGTFWAQTFTSDTRHKGLPPQRRSYPTIVCVAYSCFQAHLILYRA